MKKILRDTILNPLGEYGYLVGSIVKDIAQKGVKLSDLTKQIVNIGNNSFMIVFLTNVFTGMVLALLSHPLR